MEAVTHAFRSYRRSVSGEQLTEEIPAVPRDDQESEAE